MEVMDVVKIVATLVVFVLCIGVIAYLGHNGKSFTVRVFSALGLGVVFGIGVQVLFGSDSDTTKTVLDWISIIGTGYVYLLQMLVMPLVFVSIVGAFTRSGVTNNFGKISAIVLVTLLGTCAIAALVGYTSVMVFHLGGASFVNNAVDDASMQELSQHAQTAAGLTLPQEILSFIPVNFFADLAGTRSTSTIGVVIFAAFLGVAYLKLKGMDKEESTRQAEFFAKIIDSLYGIVMRVVRMVISLTPYGVLALIAKVLATSNVGAILDLSKFIVASYAAILVMLVVHALVLLLSRVNPIRYYRKVAGVLGFAFVARSSAGALPLNIETQQHALGVDAASANLSASFGLSIGQNGCAGIYPAMLATIVAPTVGVNIADPSYLLMLVVIVTISSFGVAGVGGGATFASLIVLGAMGFPIEVAAVLASVEPLIDMARTALNVDDAMVAGVTASHFTGHLDKAVFNDPDARVSTSVADR